MNDDSLLQLRFALDKELTRRGIKYSVGEVGELLVIKHFNSTPGLPSLQKAPTGVKNVDALSRDGHRYSIKTVQKGSKTGTIYPDAINRNERLFEFLLIARLNEIFELIQIIRFSWDLFQEVKAWDKRMNAWYVPTSLKRISKGEKIFDSQNGNYRGS